MVKVVMVGIGGIGAEIARYLVERSHTIVAAVDSDPSKSGRTLAELTGLPVPCAVASSIGKEAADADVAVISTKSRLADVAKGVLEATSMGLDVVTTSEEMSFPWSADPEAAARIDALAKEKGTTVVGVGVNPGFVMDAVPALVLTASRSPSTVHVTRSVNVGRRRRQLQAKTGVGLTEAAFEEGLRKGALGHVGLGESARLIAMSLGRELEELRQATSPVMDSRGLVAGVKQFAEGRAGPCGVRLDLEMTTASADFDLVEVRGDPDITLRFEGGVFGDSATVAVAVHAAERVAKARPGLITVLDLPLSGTGAVANRKDF